MIHLGPFTLRLERGRRARPRSARGHGRPTARTWALLVVPVLVLASLVIGVGPAGASTTATATGSMAVAVRSVSVSPATFVLDDCTLDGTPTILQFPDDQCDAPMFTITNGTAVSHIDMAVSAFKPSDRRPGWNPCGAPGGPVCTGPVNAYGYTYPGPNQFTWINNWGQTFGLTPQCDQPTCPLTASGETDHDFDNLFGPSSSTDQSASFSITLTWTALP